MTEAWPDTADAFLEKLVGFDTVSRESNMALIDFVAGFLRDHGVEPEIIPNPDGTKANLFATIGPADTGGVILSGHTDVVPVEGQDWSSDPFTLTERGDYYYGRGTTDMKGFLAVVLSLVPEFVKTDLAVPIHLAFSYDEEVGCVGVGSMIDRLAARAPSPKMCIVGEPTEMRLVTRHKGIRAYATEVAGLEAHSSRTDEGVNAIAAAARLIGHLDSIAADLAANAAADSPFTPPYTTLSVGRITGGTAVNIIPRHCRFEWEYRTLPGSDPDTVIDRFTRFAEQEVLPAMRRVHPDAGIHTEQLADAPYLAAAADSSAETLLLSLLNSNERHAVAYVTEAGHFQGIDIPTVVCGPGSIKEAHKPDEFVAKDQLRECTALLKRLAERLTAPL